MARRIADPVVAAGGRIDREYPGDETVPYDWSFNAIERAVGGEIDAEELSNAGHRGRTRGTAGGSSPVIEAAGIGCRIEANWRGIAEEIGVGGSVETKTEDEGGNQRAEI